MLAVKLISSFLNSLMIRFRVCEPLTILENVPTAAIDPQMPISTDGYNAVSTTSPLFRFINKEPGLTKFKR